MTGKVRIFVLSSTTFVVGHNFWKKEKKKKSLTSKCSGFFFHLLVMFTLPNEEKRIKIKL